MANPHQQNISKKSRFEQDDDEADDAPRPLRSNNNKNKKCINLPNEEKACDIDLTKEDSVDSYLNLPPAIKSPSPLVESPPRSMFLDVPYKNSMIILLVNILTDAFLFVLGVTTEKYGVQITRLIHRCSHRQFIYYFEPKDNEIFYTKGDPQKIYFARKEGVIIQLDAKKHHFDSSKKKKQIIDLETGDCFWYGNYLMVQTGWNTNRDIVPVRDYYSENGLIKRIQENHIKTQH